MPNVFFRDRSYRCPLCGTALPRDPPMPGFEAPCAGCGCRLWCRQRLAADHTELAGLPRRTPTPADIQRLVTALVQRSAHRRVVFDLSAMDWIDTCFVARLVALNKQLHNAGGELVLQGLGPILREMFQHFRLDKVLQIITNEQAA